MQLGLHFILSISHEGYGNATSLGRIKSSLTGQLDPSREVPDEYRWSAATPPPISTRKANATIVMLARNSDLKGIMKSMKQMEDRFNKQFQYPYTFLNEEPFSGQFKECGYLRCLVCSKTDGICSLGVFLHSRRRQLSLALSLTMTGTSRPGSTRTKRRVPGRKWSRIRSSMEVRYFETPSGIHVT